MSDSEHIPATVEEIEAIRVAHYDDGGDCATCVSGYFDAEDGWCVSRDSFPCQQIRVIWAWDALREYAITMGEATDAR